jgi:hypothetical protein
VFDVLAEHEAATDRAAPPQAARYVTPRTEMHLSHPNFCVMSLNRLTMSRGPELDGPVNRQVLMIEIDGPDVESAARRISAALPDAQVWGEVDPVEAALLVIDAGLVAAA